MLVYQGTFLQTQVVATICDRALGYPSSPQGWDGTPWYALERCDSVPNVYAGTTRQFEYIWLLTSADCYYPLSNATAAIVAASPVIGAADKAVVAAAAAARIDVANPAASRTPNAHYIGGLTYWLGDSLTQAAGMRYYLKQFQVANHYVTNQVGIYRDSGSFVGFYDNATSGQGGDTCAMMTARCAAELATFPLTKFACLMAGSNDAFLGIPASPNYATLLATLHSALVASQPTARIAVTTIPPRNDVDVSSYNAALPAIWDNHDILHPANPVIRWNAFSGIGGVWNPAYYIDSVHLNNTGYAMIVQNPTPGVGMAVSTQAYLSVIGLYP